MMTRANPEPDARPEPARLTPYELVFGPEVFEREFFPGILEESENRGVESADPGRFLMLGTVGELLGKLLPEEAPGTAVEQYGRLLHQSFNFWRFDRRLYLLDPPLARHLARDDPGIGEWEMHPPYPAGYLQLPRHLFWSRVEDDATPEAVDGLFWTMVGEDDPAAPPYERLDVLLVLGLRPDRAGFGSVHVGEELGRTPLGHWGDADARPDGRDFGNILPGGELDALHALVTPGEVLKLVSLIFWYVATRPRAVGAPERAGGAEAAGETAGVESGANAEVRPGGEADASGDRAESAEAASPHAPPPTRLEYRRISRVAADG